jgi:hypothetical protein
MRLIQIEGFFLWHGPDSAHKKSHLVNWAAVCLPKSNGGLENYSVLAKWIWKWLDTSDSL